MKITLDTTRGVIIVPDTFYATRDKENQIIKEAGGNPIDYVEWVQLQWNKAMQQPLVRKSDITSGRK